MVSRVVEQQQAISAVLAEDQKNWYLIPSSTIEAFFYSQVMDALFGEKQVVVSAILFALKHIQKAMGETEGERRLAMEIKKVISNYLEGRNLSNEIQRHFGIVCFWPSVQGSSCRRERKHRQQKLPLSLLLPLYQL